MATWAIGMILSSWINPNPPAIIVSESIPSELAIPWFQTSQFLERVDIFPADGGAVGPPIAINTCSLFLIEQTAFSPVCPSPQLPSILVMHDLPLKPPTDPIMIEVEEVVASNVTDNHNPTVEDKGWYERITSLNLIARCKEWFKWFGSQVSNNCITTEATRWYKWFTRETKNNFLLSLLYLYLCSLTTLFRYINCSHQKEILEKHRQLLEKKIKAMNDGHHADVQATQNFNRELDQAIQEIASLIQEKCDLTQEKGRVIQERDGLSLVLFESENRNKELVLRIGTASEENSRLKHEKQELAEFISKTQLVHCDEISDLSKSHSLKVHELGRKIEELEKNSAMQATKLNDKLRTAIVGRYQAQKEIEAYKQAKSTQQTLVGDPEDQVQEASATHINDQARAGESHREDDHTTTHDGMIVPRGPRNNNQTPRSGATRVLPAKGLGQSKFAAPTDQAAPASPADSAMDPIPDQSTGTLTAPPTPATELGQSRWANVEQEVSQESSEPDDHETGNGGEPIRKPRKRGGRKVQHKRQRAAEFKAAAEAQGHQPGHNDGQDRVLRPGWAPDAGRRRQA